jgi:hypothetical protein
LAVALFSLVCLAPIHAEITVGNVVTVAPTSSFNATVYNAGTADKLVVVVAGEHNFGGNTSGQINTVTYGGVALTRLVDRNPIDSSNITAADIWYLDNPAASGTMAATVAGNGNNYAWIILSLTGTADGAGGTAISAANSKTVDLTATGPSSYVIAAHALGGDGNTGSTSGITANSPATLLGARVAGTNWTGLVVSGTSGVGAGTATYGFTGGATGGNVTIAAEFLSAAPPVVTPFDLVITPNANPGQYDFQWDSQQGKVYDLVSSTDLSTAPDTWPVWDGQADLAASPPTNTLGNIAGGGDVRRFFAVLEKDAPPLLSEDFESGLPGAWVPSDNGAGTAWQAGTPDGTGTFPDTEPTAAANGTQCAGTNITATYTASATASLISPAFTVPAGGATLNFNLYIDTESPPSGDVGSIRLLNAADNSVLAGGTVTATDLEGVTEEWSAQSLALPAAANGLEVKIEFLFSSDADTELFAGFYIDDVLVEAN